jgi:hypothetical protein
MDKEIKKQIEQILPKSFLIHDETATLYIIVASTMELYTGSLSTFKVDRILMDYFNKSENDVKGAKFRLKKTRFLEPDKEDKRRFTVHKKGKMITKRQLEKIDEEKRNHFINLVKRKTKEIKSDGGNVNWRGVREGRERIGLDLLTYVDAGERDRVLGALRTYGDRCGKVYVLHAQFLDQNFKVEVERELKEIATYPPRFIEVEAWDPNEFNKELLFLRNPRRQLDIIFSAMPREAVVTLFINLNLPETLCSQRWIYNEAEEYKYGKGKLSYSYSTGTHDGFDSNSNILVLFGENYPIRFEEISVLSLYGYDKVYMGLGQSNGTDKEYLIDKKSYKTMKPFLTKNSETFSVSYTSTWDVFNQMRYIKPTEIVVSGNRVIALGVAMYYVHCVKNSDDFPIPKLTMAHVSAREYSKGIGSQNIEILKI